eukprot:1430343-Alexandrium_andersonii.AAC.1
MPALERNVCSNATLLEGAVSNTQTHANVCPRATKLERPRNVWRRPERSREVEGRSAEIRRDPG